MFKATLEKYDEGSIAQRLISKGSTKPKSLTPTSTPKNRLSVAFVSKHFRKHSICKLFCPFIHKLASTNPKITESGTIDIDVHVLSAAEKVRTYLFFFCYL